jgi:hypothetical protein
MFRIFVALMVVGAAVILLAAGVVSLILSFLPYELLGLAIAAAIAIPVTVSRMRRNRREQQAAWNANARGGEQL